MFILTKISDLVQITPEDLKKPSREAIEDNINAKYANKVIQKIGLCICLYDLLSASDGLIGHGTGLVNVNVEFRLVVFRPFKHEVMLGKISSSHPSGIKVRTHFFDEIFVPGYNLPESAYFDHTEQIWVWTYDSSPLYYDHHETVRFRIDAENWVDQTPSGPQVGSSGTGSSGVHGLSGFGGGGVNSLGGGGFGGVGGFGTNGHGDGGKESPYQIVGTMNEEGLGLALWWDGAGEEEEGGEGGWEGE